MLLEGDNPGTVTTVETKILDPNAISAATNSDITNNTGVYYDSDNNQHLRHNPMMNIRKMMNMMMMTRIIIMTMTKSRK